MNIEKERTKRINFSIIVRVGGFAAGLIAGYLAAFLNINIYYVIPIALVVAILVIWLLSKAYKKHLK